MKNLIEINGHSIEKIEYKGQPVITQAQIDELHNRPEGTAKRNFNENRERFMEGKDYFKVPHEEWKNILSVRNSSSSGGYRGEMTLWTYFGYTMLVKSFQDDLAWKVQRQLSDNYFSAGISAGQPIVQLSQNDSDAMSYLLSAVDTIQSDMAKLTELRKYDDSPVAPFCDDQCSYKAGGFILKDEIYSRYESYCYIKEEYTLSKPVFFRRLYKYASFVKSVKRIIKSKTSHGITGLSLKDLSSIQLIEGGA